jgi:hypothetical protein
MESRDDLNLLCTAISQFIKRENSVNIRADQIILPLKSIVDQILKFLHFDLHNNLID